MAALLWLFYLAQIVRRSATERTRRSGHRCFEIGERLVPVHDIPPVLEIFCTAVLVFQVVCVLPPVDADNGACAEFERCLLIARADDVELSVPVHHEPCPARAEPSETGSGELFGQAGIAAERDPRVRIARPERSAQSIAGLKPYLSELATLELLLLRTESKQTASMHGGRADAIDQSQKGQPQKERARTPGSFQVIWL